VKHKTDERGVERGGRQLGALAIFRLEFCVGGNDPSLCDIEHPRREIGGDDTVRFLDEHLRVVTGPAAEFCHIAQLSFFAEPFSD